MPNASWPHGWLLVVGSAPCCLWTPPWLCHQGDPPVGICSHRRAVPRARLLHQVPHTQCLPRFSTHSVQGERSCSANRRMFLCQHSGPSLFLQRELLSCQKSKSAVNHRPRIRSVYSFFPRNTGKAGSFTTVPSSWMLLDFQQLAACHLFPCVGSAHTYGAADGGHDYVPRMTLDSAFL